MKLTVIGSHLCPNTLYALNKLKEKEVEFEFQNLSASFPALKAYLNVRESDPMYEPVKEANMIGIPLFEFEDGTRTFDLKEVLNKA